LLSDYILDEFAEHYVGKFKATRRQAALVVATLRKHAEIVVPEPVSQDALDDVDDLPVLGTAVAGKADYLVTGDKQLRKLGNSQRVAIVTPREFYDNVRGSE
jgi:predicted nucleic acid-binding protein